MSAKKVLEIENVTRAAAVWGSAAAAVIFVVGFATDYNLITSMGTMAIPAFVNPAVITFLTLLASVFAAYAIAGLKRWELTGSALAIAAVVAIYGWAHAVFSEPPSLYLLVLAAPALLHVAAVVSHRSVGEVVKEPAEERNVSELIPAAA